MTPWEIAAGAIVALTPPTGWVISVERRLSALLTTKEQLEKIEAKVDRLIDKLIEE